MAPMVFGENVDPTAAIRAILDSYPFSIGLLRELLQNSDDALASKQMFVLDCRTFPTVSLVHPKLAEMQGPALLGYSNKPFTEEDWRALQNIHRSSKKNDPLKIGKYGIGFRSCYHVTDGPQILSGSELAILDPRHEIWTEGGTKIDFIEDPQFVDQLSSFGSIFSGSPPGVPFPGSIIRLPLRITQSTISREPVGIPDIRKLLLDFISEEIAVTLLFLESISSIEVLEINARGGRSTLARSEIRRTPKVPSWIGDIQNDAFTCVVKTSTHNRRSTTEQWRILHTSFPQSDATFLLSERAGCDPSATLSAHKLRPDVGLAIPFSVFTQSAMPGRLYTYLPLPLQTRFPLHIHSPFALTQSRQNLRNREEKGIVRGSDDSVLVEWNQLLFDVYIPQAWMYLLSILVDTDGVPDVFKAWPHTQGGQDGDSGYWKDLPMKLLDCVVKSGAAVWPVIGPPDISGVDHCIINASPARNKVLHTVRKIFKVRPSKAAQAATTLPSKPGRGHGLREITFTIDGESEMAALQSLAALGLKITRIPAHVYDLLTEYDGGVRPTLLTPKIAHTILLRNVAASELTLPSNTDLISAAAAYLVSDGDLTNIAGLPLITHPSGRCITLEIGSRTIYTMLEEAEFNLFGGFINDAIALHVLDATLATLLKDSGPTDFSVRPLTPQTVVGCLEMNPNPLGLKFDSGNVDPAVIHWLTMFWVWLGGWSFKDGLYNQIPEYYLLPSSNGLMQTTYSIFTLGDIRPGLLPSFRQLGIPFFHRDFPESAQQALRSFRSLSKPNDLRDLLDSLSWGQIKTLRLGEEAARTILRHFIQVSSGSAEITHDQRIKLKALPIFPVIQPTPLATVWGNIPREKNVISVSMPVEGLRIFPTIRNVVFLDGSMMGLSFLTILHPEAGGSLSGHDILSLALTNFATQTEEVQTGIMEYMAAEGDRLPVPVFEQFLQTMESVSILECFKALRASSHTQFAGWLRNKIPTVPEHLRSVARELPIWPSMQPFARGMSWLPANGLKMLPAGPAATAVTSFLNIPIVLYSSYLQSLAVEPMTWVEIFQTVQTSTPKLSPPHKQKYLDFLKALLNPTPPAGLSWVLVPNCYDMLCPSDSLYARDALFCAAFGSVSPHFVADDFQHLEQRLGTTLGLISERDLNIDMFRECAAALNSDTSPEGGVRARIVFKVYYEKLPLHDRDPHHWDTLDDLNFIPRKAFGRKTMANRNISAYLRYRNLPDTVAPKDILLEKYEAIAWTQRTLLLEEPSPNIMQTILNIKPNFGQPSISDVVQHLRVLALQMSVDYPQDRALLGDLRTTYQWLDDHSEEVQPQMIQHRSERLFLNVADPETGAWRWCSAQELLFGVSQRSCPFHIQHFLLSFRELLRVSGVETIIEARLPEDADDNLELPAESELLRSAFCSMRDARQLTDVILIPDKEDGESAMMFPAHRAYLAACGTYFLDAFGGEFQESGLASAYEPVQMRVKGYSSSSVQVLLDFLYTGVVVQVAQDLLIEVMQLSIYWGIRPSQLYEAVQRQIVLQGLITPDTYKIVTQRAGGEASIVFKACKQYELDNQAILERLNITNRISMPSLPDATPRNVARTQRDDGPVLGPRPMPWERTKASIKRHTRDFFRR